MIRVDFGQGQEIVQFEGASDLRNFAKSQQSEWRNWAHANALNVGTILSDWLAFAGSSGHIAENANGGQQWVAQHRPILFGSKLGNLIKNVFKSERPALAEVVIESWRTDKASEQIPAEVASTLRGLSRPPFPSISSGAHEYEDYLARLRTEFSRLDTDAASTFARFETRLGELSRQAAEQINSAQARVTAANDLYEEFVLAGKAREEAFFSELQARWDANIASQSERINVGAASELWASRSEEHSKRAKASKWYLAAAGVGGIFAAYAWVRGTFIFIRSLFSELAPRRAEAGDVLHLELIVASVSTLFYLTLFIWLLRLIIRRQMMEEHLAVDANARSAMSKTYIALINEQGANADTDRAIVLEALFRPVTDGIVKDDGPPALTPAAILSAFASSKGGGS